MLKIRIAFVFLALIGASCRRGDDPSLPVPRSAVSPTDGSGPVSPDPASCERVNGGADRQADTFAYLSDVRASDHGSSDRIVFEFSPADSVDSKIPRFEIEEVNPPFTKDPSDQPMQVEGQRFFRVIFHGATGVELRDETVIERYRGPKEMKLGLEVLKEAEQQGDFEATLSWVMGLGKLRCPEVTELQDPLRVAIDFPH